MDPPVGPKPYATSILPIALLAQVVTSDGHYFFHCPEYIVIDSRLKYGLICEGFWANLDTIEEKGPGARTCIGA